MKVMMKKIKLRVWDPSTYLLTEADMAFYLSEAMNEADPGLISLALDDVACALRVKLMVDAVAPRIEARP